MQTSKQKINAWIAATNSSNTNKGRVTLKGIKSNPPVPISTKTILNITFIKTRLAIMFAKSRINKLIGLKQ